jgi:hypothetical protein
VPAFTENLAALEKYIDVTCANKRKYQFALDLVRRGIYLRSSLFSFVLGEGRILVEVVKRDGRGAKESNGG